MVLFIMLRLTVSETINSGGKHGNQTNDPIFFYLLFPLYFFITFVFVFENCQNSFSCGPTFGPFWSVKYLNFGQKLPIWTAQHTFLESRHSEVFENLYYVLSPEEIQREVSAHGLYNQNLSSVNSKNLLGVFHATTAPGIVPQKMCLRIFL